MIAVGDEMIYRLRKDSPSEHVRVTEIDTSKKTPRYVVEFLDGEKTGTIENVPGKRLRGPWSGVAEYDILMANWQRIDCYSSPKTKAVSTKLGQQEKASSSEFRPSNLRSFCFERAIVASTRCSFLMWDTDLRQVVFSQIRRAFLLFPRRWNPNYIGGSGFSVGASIDISHETVF